MEAELVALQAEAQLVLESERLAELARHLAAEHLVASASGLLGGVHGDVGAADQLLATRLAVARVDDDADARAERERAVGDGRRQREPLEQALGEGDGELLAALDEHGELVAAEARDGVARARDLLEARGDLQQQLIADVVAEVVVDLLEAVEVDEQQRERLARERAARERVVEAVAEEGAVGEPGEAVVERLARQLLLEHERAR